MACPPARFAPAATVALLALLLSLPAQATQLRIAWLEDRPADGILTPAALLAIHGGGIDFYDHDRPAPALLGQVLPALLSGSGARMLVVQLRDQHPGADFRAFSSLPVAVPGWTPPPLAPLSRYATLVADPQQHRYLSWLVTVQPSNDAFAGNEDPYRHRLFDDQGRFLGPFVIEVFGADVLDAGLCDNTETALAWLELPWPATQPCVGGEGVVGPHPGLNGSQRNLDATPVNVLGATHHFDDQQTVHYGVEAADFTRPGVRLGRLLVSRANGWMDTTGSWYSPERDGEGFSVQLMPPDAPGGPARLLVYWYTYAADGSGEQVWLSGLGDVAGSRWPEATVPLHRTEGGGFASTANPDTVVRSPWGELQLRFTGCDSAEISYQANDATFGSGGFEVFRLGEPVEGLGWLCDPRDPYLLDAAAAGPGQQP